MLICFYKYKNCKTGENKMQKLFKYEKITKQIKKGFENQDIYYVKGTCIRTNDEMHLIRYFPTNNVIKLVNQIDEDGLTIKMPFKEFDFACQFFLQTCKDVEIINVMGDKIPLQQYKYDERKNIYA